MYTYCVQRSHEPSHIVYIGHMYLHIVFRSLLWRLLTLGAVAAWPVVVEDIGRAGPSTAPVAGDAASVPDSADY